MVIQEHSSKSNPSVMIYHQKILEYLIISEQLIHSFQIGKFRFLMLYLLSKQILP